jgi:predicted amidophosphoribosyltransferase
MNNLCPVCGYKHTPEEHSICSCCGTEFGYDDCSLSHEELRNNWLKNGAKWFSTVSQPSGGWNYALAFHQLYKSNLLKTEFRNNSSTFDTSPLNVDEFEYEVVA